MVNSENFSWYIVTIFITVLLLVSAVLIEIFIRKNIAIKKLSELLKTGAFLSPTVLSIAIGILFLISAWQNYLFAPGLGLNETLLGIVLRLGQATIGIGLILGIGIRWLTLGIIALFVAGFFMFPVLDMFDYIIFLGIAIFLFLIHDDTLSFGFFFHPVEKIEIFDKYRKYALPILRILTGLGIAYAALYHNIINPDSAIKLLDERPVLNIFQSIFGLSDVTNQHLIFQIGLGGILVGILLTFSIIERFTSFLIGLGLLITIFIMGLSFLPLAIPYFAIIYIFITGNQFEERELAQKA